MERPHRAAKQNSKDRGTYSSAGSIASKPKTSQSATPIAAPSDTMVSPSKTTKSPRKSAKGKDKAVDSDVDPETDDGGRVAPSRRPKSARQTALEKDPKTFLRRQVEKSKRERQAALAAEESSAADDTETTTATKPAKTPASKKSAPTKRAPAATKSTKSSTIQGGNITKAATVEKQPQKSKRKHRPADYGYETVPDDSDDEEKQRDTIAKLRETINRHARWCPFVRMKKQLRRVHRSTSRLEMPDSEDNNATTEPEEDDNEENDEDAELEEDQSDAESDGGEGTQPSKKKQSGQTGKKKAAPTKPALKPATTKARTSKAAASSKKTRFENPGLSKEREETSDGAEANNDSESEVPEADESEVECEANIATATTELNSDEELSSLDNDKVGQLKEAHEQEQNDLNKQATDLSSDKDAGSPKRKSAEFDSGQSEKEAAKKQRRST